MLNVTPAHPCDCPSRFSLQRFPDGTEKSWCLVYTISGRRSESVSKPLKMHFGQRFRGSRASTFLQLQRVRLPSHGEKPVSQGLFTCTNSPKGALRFLWLATLLQSPGLDRAHVA